MTLNRFIEDVGVQFQVFIWGDVEPRPAHSDDSVQLRRQACEAVTALSRQRALRDELTRRLAEEDKRRVALATRVRIYHHVGDHANAWRYALELDRLRSSVEHQRNTLRLAEKRYRLQRAHVERLLEKLAEI